MTQSASLPATRDAALGRLHDFVARAGRTYAGRRNYDLGRGDRTNVSGLSPYLRHRLITEDEVVSAVLAQHSLNGAEKFIQEVCWRTYWKGWLEQRPSVWTDYLEDLALTRVAFENDAIHRMKLDRAIAGETGIECFDAWAQELRETGYLHNHSRMWFASIWIFTLELPWVLWR
jgi:deoxyribodipyrimidine photo-lyase